MSKDTRLAIAQNLVRIYRQVLDEPAPPHLIDLVKRLAAGDDKR